MFVELYYSNLTTHRSFSSVLQKKEFEVPTNPSSEDEMSRDDLITFVEFVHHCTLPSKDKLIEELRTVHKTVTSSRAQATRKLDSIAEKKRNPNGGVYWEVRRDILEELGLKELLVSNVADFWSYAPVFCSLIIIKCDHSSSSYPRQY
jgi:hypothetical protein